MSFDTLAPHYHWMERLFAGKELQRCRTAFLHQLPPPANALIFGEGDGRFLLEYRRTFPYARATVVDSSAGMLQRARKRLSQAGFAHSDITFVQADAREWLPPEASFDLIVTCFFLDCFREEELRSLIAKMARAATPNAQWLQADFQMAGSPLSRLRSWLTLQLLYAFFRKVTGITASAITQPDPMLSREGFVCRQRSVSDWGRLYSDWWSRPTEPASPQGKSSGIF
ncbi:MAG: class I SAM-dependent methyltransferase [Verrucomicrobiota bacterium]